MRDELPSYKEAKKYFEDKGYPKDELRFYTEVELRVLCKHQRERENE